MEKLKKRLKIFEILFGNILFRKKKKNKAENIFLINAIIHISLSIIE